jgi:hypothetical protein
LSRNAVIRSDPGQAAAEQLLGIAREMPMHSTPSLLAQWQANAAPRCAMKQFRYDIIVPAGANQQVTVYVGRINLPTSTRVTVGGGSTTSFKLGEDNDALRDLDGGGCMVIASHAGIDFTAECTLSTDGRPMPSGM